MAAFFSISQRKTNNGANFSGDQSAYPKNEQSMDPWNLGVSTSTSTAESNTEYSSTDDASRYNSLSAPPTPEGLRPRKSIQRIRKEVFGSNHYKNERINPRHRLPLNNTKETNTLCLSQRICLDSSPFAPQVQSPAPPFSSSGPSFQRQPNIAVLPPFYHQRATSSINSSSSFYEQSIEENGHINDEDFEMDSSLDYSYSRRNQVAVSPDLNRSGRAKTAVGALLVAMTETCDQPMVGNDFKPKIQNEISRHSILPPRTWLDNHPRDEKYLANRYADEDDTIREDFDEFVERGHAYHEDNQSSLHASPSSLRRKAYDASWAHQREKHEQDTSFTRRILGDDPSSSRLEERSIVDQCTYNFNSIMTEEKLDMNAAGAPRILSLIKDTDGMDLSAISHSLHQNVIESVNTSLADTVDDQEDEYQEIPRYYQALTDDIPARNVANDDALLLAKAQNERQRKENLLRSVFERLQGSLDVLREVYPQSTIDNSFFLDMGKAGIVIYNFLETLLAGLENNDSCEAQRRALRFCMSILQNTEVLHHRQNPFPNLSKPLWVPTPGFRSSLGLEEEPQSPPSVARGADTSLFSLPSDSANDATPHTSNVSITSTLTTIVSPEKYGSDVYKLKLGIRKTIESLARLLHKLEASCVNLKSVMTTTENSMVVGNILRIYFDFINLPLVDLEWITDSFEIDFTKQQFLSRTVSADQGVAASALAHTRPFVHDNERNEAKESIPFTRDDLRINVVQCNNENVDDNNHIQSIECDLWSPTTNDMRSLVSPDSTEATINATNGDYAALVDTEEPVDDLRRTVGSFDYDRSEEEREEAPQGDENEDQRDYRGAFPATFGRRVVVQRPRKSRFWKKRFLALKNRGRQVTAE